MFHQADFMASDDCMNTVFHSTTICNIKHASIKRNVRYPYHAYKAMKYKCIIIANYHVLVVPFTFYYFVSKSLIFQRPQAASPAVLILGDFLFPIITKIYSNM